MGERAACSSCPGDGLGWMATPCEECTPEGRRYAALERIAGLLGLDFTSVTAAEVADAVESALPGEGVTCTARPRPSCSRPDGQALRRWDRGHVWEERGAPCAEPCPLCGTELLAAVPPEDDDLDAVNDEYPSERLAYANEEYGETHLWCPRCKDNIWLGSVTRG